MAWSSYLPDLDTIYYDLIAQSSVSGSVEFIITDVTYYVDFYHQTQTATCRVIAKIRIRGGNVFDDIVIKRYANTNPRTFLSTYGELWKLGSEQQYEINHLYSVSWNALPESSDKILFNPPWGFVWYNGTAYLCRVNGEPGYVLLPNPTPTDETTIINGISYDITYDPQITPVMIVNLDDHNSVTVTDHLAKFKVALLECDDGPLLLDDPEVLQSEADALGLEVRGDYAYYM